jgi:hypothetical protein
MTERQMYYVYVREVYEHAYAVYAKDETEAYDLALNEYWIDLDETHFVELEEGCEWEIIPVPYYKSQSPMEEDWLRYYADKLPDEPEEENDEDE